MRAIHAAGLPIQVQPPPQLCELASRALHAWVCMGRELALERLPAFCALYPQPDPEALAEMLVVLDQAIATAAADATRAARAQGGAKVPR